MEIKISRKGLSTKQIQSLDAKQDYLLFGGARGGGKTHVGRIKAVEAALRFPGRNVIFVRPTMKSASEQFTTGKMSQIIPSKVRDPETEEVVELWRYNKKDFVFEFANGSNPDDPFEGGSRIMLGGIVTKSDAEDRYQGIEFVQIVWDELTKAQWAAVTYLIGSLRDTEYDVQFWASSNPGGKSHQEVKAKYVDPWTKIVKHKKLGKDYTRKLSWRAHNIDEMTGEKLYSTYTYIPATLDDNPVKRVRDTYKKQIAEEPNEVIRKMYRNGSWDVFRGRYWDNIDFEKDVQQTREGLAEKFNIDFDWEKKNGNIFMSMDWGYNDYASIHWHLETSSGTVITFKEMYRNKTLMEDLAKAVEEYNMMHDINPREIYMPWDLYIKKGGKFTSADRVLIGEELIDVWREYCTVMDVKASGDRKQGWSNMTKALKNKNLITEIVDGEVMDIEKPKWLILQGAAQKLVTQLSSAEMNENDLEDITKGMEDHAIDSARMFWIAYQPSAKVREKIELPPEGTLERMRMDLLKEQEEGRIFKQRSLYDSDW